MASPLESLSGLEGRLFHYDMDGRGDGEGGIGERPDGAPALRDMFREFDEGFDGSFGPTYKIYFKVADCLKPKGRDGEVEIQEYVRAVVRERGEQLWEIMDQTGREEVELWNLYGELDSKAWKKRNEAIRDRWFKAFSELSQMEGFLFNVQGISQENGVLFKELFGKH